MDKSIPRSLIAVIAEVFSSHYTHTQINSQFFSAEFPGDPPEGNKQDKCHSWLIRANKLCSDPMAMVGKLLEELMETIPPPTWGDDVPSVETYRQRIIGQLKALGLSYQTGGRIMHIGATSVARTLEQKVAERDMKGVQKEFDRILSNLESDPPTAVTASCALLESLFKTYIADEGLLLPSDESVLPLWKVIRSHLKLDPAEVQDESLKKILSGLASITDGVASLRTKRGSAHGHDLRTSFRIEPRHARLAANAAFAVATFFIEVVEARKLRILRREMAALPPKS